MTKGELDRYQAMMQARFDGYRIILPPSLDHMLWELLFGMLGIGTLRSIDKRLGTAR